ncbi:protein of unknown function [Burkholderia multivorans]
MWRGKALRPWARVVKRRIGLC